MKIPPNEHLSLEYGGGWLESRTPETPFSVAFSRCTRQPEDFRSECIRTARLVGQQAEALGRVPMIMLSGGLDSHVVASAFLEAGVKFVAVTYEFAKGKNSLDVALAKSFAKEHGIEHHVFCDDFIDWANTDDAAQLFHSVMCASVGYLPLLRMVRYIWDELNGFPVMGEGDLWMEKIDGKWFHVEYESGHSLHRLAVARGIQAAIWFFQHTAELHLSMLRESRIEELGLGNNDLANKVHDTCYFVKSVVYRKYWPDLKYRVKLKGTEQVMADYAPINRRLLQGRADLWHDRFLMPYSWVRAQLEPSETAYLPGEALPTHQMQPRRTDES